MHGRQTRVSQSRSITRWANVKREHVRHVSRRADEFESVVLRGHGAQRKVAVGEGETERETLRLLSIVARDIQAQRGRINVRAADGL